MGETNRRIVLVERPTEAVQSTHFRLEQGNRTPCPEECVVVRNLYFSIDPTIRDWMDERKSYLPPIAIGAPIRSGVLGEVVESRVDGWRAGDLTATLGTWEEYSVVHKRMLGRKIVPVEGVPLTGQLSVLGGNGLTAYYGMCEVGKPESGETVLVSAAAGGVGSVAGQIARIHGARVVGVAGSDEKCAWLVDELSFDAAFNYKREDLCDAIRRTCPDGVDVFFDNVGGQILNAALAHINLHARVVLCGAISQLGAKMLPPGPANYVYLLTKRATMRGFVTMDYASRWSETSATLADWVREDKLRWRDHIVDGLENAPAALIGLFAGDNIGKMLVRV